MKARMLENEKEMMEMKKTYEEKLKQSKMEHVVRGGGVRPRGNTREWKDTVA